MLSISCVLLFISTSFAAAVPPAGSTIASIAPSLLADTSHPVCVNSLQERLWETRDRKPLSPYDCAYALLGAKISLRNNSKASFDFHSKDHLSIVPQRGWELPYGATSANGGSNECVVVVRMTRDFSPKALPFTNGSYNIQTRDAARVQEENWKVITKSLDAVQANCINRKMGGWVSIGDGNIIAAIWPKGSGIDVLYNYNVSVAEARFLLENGTNPIGDGAVSPA